MKLTLLAKAGCADSSCPAVYTDGPPDPDGPGGLVVQGPQLTEAEVQALPNRGPGESGVRIDVATFKAAAASLAASGGFRRELTRAEFGDLLTGFRYSAYRLEVLPEYQVASENDSLAAWAAGQWPMVGPDKQEWQEIVASATAAGKIMQRVHLVTEPLTPYLEWEIGWGYLHSRAAGEDIRILSVTEGDTAREELTADYWLFDSETLVWMEYDRGGRLSGIVADTDPAAVVRACNQRDAALHAATPYSQYAEGRSFRSVRRAS